MSTMGELHNRCFLLETTLKTTLIHIVYTAYTDLRNNTIFMKKCFLMVQGNLRKFTEFFKFSLIIKVTFSLNLVKKIKYLFLLSQSYFSYQE